MRFEPAGMTDDPELRIATSLGRLHLPPAGRSTTCRYEERLELGMLTTRERTQPTLPGVEEMATPTSGVVEDGMSDVWSAPSTMQTAVCALARG